MYCSILCDFFLLHGRRLLPFHSYFCSQRKFVHFVSISIFLLISILQCVQLCCSNWFVIDGVVGVVVYMGGGRVGENCCLYLHRLFIEIQNFVSNENGWRCLLALIMVLLHCSIFLFLLLFFVTGFIVLICFERVCSLCCFCNFFSLVFFCLFCLISIRT